MNRGSGPNQTMDGNFFQDLANDVNDVMNDVAKWTAGSIATLTQTIYEAAGGNVSAILEVTVIVGVAILCPYAYAAWEAETGADVVGAAVTADLSAEAANAAAYAAETGVTTTVSSVTAEVSAEAANAAAYAAETGTTSTISTVAPDLVDPGTNLVTSDTIGTSATADVSAQAANDAAYAAETGTGNTAAATAFTPSDSFVPATTSAALPSTGSALGDAIVKAVAVSTLTGITGDLIMAATGQKIPTPATVPVLTAPAATVPNWVWLAGAAALLILVID